MEEYIRMCRISFRLVFIVDFLTGSKKVSREWSKLYKDDVVTKIIK